MDSTIHVDNIKPLTRVQIKRALIRIYGKRGWVRRAAAAIDKSHGIVGDALSGQKKAEPTLERLRVLIESHHRSVHVDNNQRAEARCQGQTLPHPSLSGGIA